MPNESLIQKHTPIYIDRCVTQQYKEVVMVSLGAFMSLHHTSLYYRSNIYCKCPQVKKVWKTTTALSSVEKWHVRPRTVFLLFDTPMSLLITKESNKW